MKNFQDIILYELEHIQARSQEFLRAGKVYEN